MTTTQLEKWRLDFPPVTDADVAFGGFPAEWFYDTLKTHDEKSSRKWDDMASKLFFSGGKVPTNKGLPEEYTRRGLRMLRAVLGSFRPSHEHKEAVAGLILKSICQLIEEEDRPE